VRGGNGLVMEAVPAPDRLDRRALKKLRFGEWLFQHQYSFRHGIERLFDLLAALIGARLGRRLEEATGVRSLRVAAGGSTNKTEPSW
jgi:hypothetical protein